jgi:hypothetical protein
MLNKSLSTHVFQVAASLTLCAFAITSQAAPYGLTGSCHLSSIIPGQGECFINVFAHDTDFITPTPIKRALVKVNGIIVSDTVNDLQNPVSGSFAGIAGAVHVPCGMKYNVVALIAPVGGSFGPEGSLPKVTCPVAP